MSGSRFAFRVAACLVSCVVASGAAADESLTALLDSRALEHAPNPVPINYLLHEGKGRLGPQNEQVAIDQLTAALRLQTSPMVTMMTGMAEATDTPTQREIDKQMQTSKAKTAAELAISMLGGPNLTQQTGPSTEQMLRVQKEIKQAMADPWIRGIEAADAYIALGDAQAAGRFYASCLAMPFGLDWLTEDCLAAVLRMGPPRSYVMLNWLVEHPEQAAPSSAMAAMMSGSAAPPIANDPSVAQLRNYGLEGLGRLIGAGELDAYQGARAFAALIAYSDGKQNAPYFTGAASGLGYSKDPRAIEPLRRLQKNAGKDASLHDATVRGLVVGFNDPAAAAELRKLLNDKDEERRFRSAAMLFQIGDQAAFDWAVGVVTAHRAAEDQTPDIRARVVRDLLENGGAAGKRTLAEIHRRGAGNDWLQAWVAVAMLEGGDVDELAEVRQALQKSGWTLDRLGVKAWWGRISPFLQLAAQFSLTGTINAKAAAQVISDLVASERGRYAQQSSLEEMLLAQLQWQAADAFAASGSDDDVSDLTKMLGDPRDVVRISAARALAVHPGAHAIDGYEAAFNADFGQEQGVARAPEVRSALLRAALIRYPQDARTTALCRTAAQDADPGVRFIALSELSARKQ